MAQQHTQGQWRVAERRDQDGPYVTSARGPIAKVYWQVRPLEALDNARLIATAPDFLRHALEAVAAWDMEADTPEHNQEDRLEAAIAGLRAAIARATGGEA